MRCVGFTTASIAASRLSSESAAPVPALFSMSCAPVRRFCRPSNSRGLTSLSPLMSARESSCPSALAFMSTSRARRSAPNILTSATSQSRSPPAMRSASESGLMTPVLSVYDSLMPRKAMPGSAPSRLYE